MGRGAGGGRDAAPCWQVPRKPLGRRFFLSVSPELEVPCSQSLNGHDYVRTRPEENKIMRTEVCTKAGRWGKGMGRYQPRCGKGSDEEGRQRPAPGLGLSCGNDESPTSRAYPELISRA